MQKGDNLHQQKNWGKPVKRDLSWSFGPVVVQSLKYRKIQISLFVNRNISIFNRDMCIKWVKPETDCHKYATEIWNATQNRVKEKDCTIEGCK